MGKSTPGQVQLLFAVSAHPYASSTWSRLPGSVTLRLKTMRQEALTPDLQKRQLGGRAGLGRGIGPQPMWNDWRLSFLCVFCFEPILWVLYLKKHPHAEWSQLAPLEAPLPGTPALGRRGQPDRLCGRRNHGTRRARSNPNVGFVGISSSALLFVFFHTKLSPS